MNEELNNLTLSQYEKELITRRRKRVKEEKEEASRLAELDKKASDSLKQEYLHIVDLVEKYNEKNCSPEEYPDCGIYFKLDLQFLTYMKDELDEEN